MNKSVLAGTLSILLMGTAAHAQLLLKEDPVTDNKVVVNMETESEAPVVAADPTTGTRPADCPAGAFFLGEDDVTDNKEIYTSCDDPEMIYRGAAEGEGTMPAEGYPEGTRLLVENDITDNKEIVTGAEADMGGEAAAEGSQ